VSPKAIVVRFEPHEGPTRRLVAHPYTEGYELECQWWRQSLGRWQTTETELLAAVSVSTAEGL